MKRLTRLVGVFDRMSLRERGLITLALGALCFFACDQLLVQPEFRLQQQLDIRLAAQQSDSERLRREIALVVAELARDDAVKAQAELQQDTPEAGGSFVGSVPYQPRLADLVSAVLAPAPGVRLLSLRTLPVRPVTAAQARKDKAPQHDPDDGGAELPVHLHGIEFSLAGSYLNLLACLQRLQGFPEPLLWGDLYLNVVSHPEALLRVTVSTVSEQVQAPLGG